MATFASQVAQDMQMMASETGEIPVVLVGCVKYSLHSVLTGIIQYFVKCLSRARCPPSLLSPPIQCLKDHGFLRK